MNEQRCEKTIKFTRTHNHPFERLVSASLDARRTFDALFFPPKEKPLSVFGERELSCVPGERERLEGMLS